MNLFKPSRQFRRQQSGKFCPACSNRLHWQDVVALRGDDQLIFLHEGCALAIAAQADAADAAEDAES